MKTRLFSAALLLLFTCGLSCAQQFITYPEFPTSGPVGNPITADFNRDGITDLAFSTGIIELGAADGSFTEAASIDVFAAGVVAADFNKDGILDLAFGTAGNDFSTVSIYNGKGDGTFTAGNTYSLSAYIYGVATGDLNGDGNVDLVVADYLSTVQVLLGNGNGSFGSPAVYTVSGNVWNVAVGDVNGDGRADVLAALPGSQGSVAVFISKTNGSLKTPVMYKAAKSTFAVALADLNGDGILDAATTGASELGVLIGKGNGTFQSPQIYTVALSTSFDVQIADFDSDGHPDILVVDAYGPYALPIFYGDGTGVFTGPVVFGVSSFPGLAAVADFNRDGRLDIAIAEQGNQFGVLYGDSNGTYLSRRYYSAQINGHEAGLTLTGIASSDVNSDGNLDLIVADQTDSQALVFPGKSNGTFRPPKRFAVGKGTTSVAAGDVNGDGSKDIVTANKTANTISVLINNGSGTFQPHVDYPALTSPTQVLLGDVNADGALDILAAESGNVSAWLNDGSGHFSARIDTNVSDLLSFAIGDFNGDGALDFALTQSDRKFNGVVVYIGDGQGHFTSPQQFYIASVGYSLAVGDINGDGIQDIVGFYSYPGQIYAFLGNGDGTFQYAKKTNTNNLAEDVSLGDFNRDGKVDVLIGNSDSSNGGYATLMFGNGDGTFQGLQKYWIDDGGASPAVIGDFNHDGALDAGFLGINGVSAYLNTGAK